VRVALRHAGAKDVPAASKLLRRIAAQLFALASAPGPSRVTRGRGLRLARSALRR
jgi:hypothetical protein